ncbi:MAG: glyoxalase [Idiomarina sp.]|uniref:VOC family protein n=1 Tax=Idiomarina sp. TaxID=1874361 RepID=UPI000C35F271|nr:VOC family protein [Idiomarina sp.]MBT43011.1 glyoxalase [Idiomarina sp.]
MQPTLSVITLITDDLVRAVSFYRDGLGLPTQGIVGDVNTDTQVAFFNLNDNLKLAIWPRRSLANQLTLTPQGNGHMLSHNVATTEQVEELITAAEQAGAKVLKQAHWQPWGCYGGYFSDPDGHFWEVTYNPGYQ